MIQFIEQAIVARLQDAANSGVTGYQVSVQATYGAHFSSVLLPESFPTLWVVFGGLGVSQHQGEGLRIPTRFFVVVAGHNSQSDISPSIYTVIDDMHRILAGQRLNLEISPLEPRRVKPLCSNKNILPWAPWVTQPYPNFIQNNSISIYSIEFRTSYDLLPIDHTELGEFSGFSTQWRPSPPV